MEGIKESLLIGYPSMIPYESHKTINEQMERYICKLYISKIQGTGFFCKIPFPDENNMLPVFITNNHILGKELLYKKDAKIKIDIKEEIEIKEIKLNNRMKYTNEEYDTTIIEIKEEDNIKNYLKLDDIIINDIINNINKNKEYINKTIYIIQYPENELSVSYGILEQIYEDKKYNFNHKCSTRGGSSGSPILNINNKLIGIHKKGYKYMQNNNNEGAFLNYPIKEFLKLNYKDNNIKIYNDKKIKFSKEKEDKYIESIKDFLEIRKFETRLEEIKKINKEILENKDDVSNYQKIIDNLIQLNLELMNSIKKLKNNLEEKESELKGEISIGIDMKITENDLKENLQKAEKMIKIKKFELNKIKIKLALTEKNYENKIKEKEDQITEIENINKNEFDNYTKKIQELNNELNIVKEEFQEYKRKELFNIEQILEDPKQTEEQKKESMKLIKMLKEENKYLENELQKRE